MTAMKKKTTALIWSNTKRDNSQLLDVLLHDHKNIVNLMGDRKFLKTSYYP